MRLTPSWARQDPKYHIERTGRSGYGNPDVGRVGLCGAAIPGLYREVDETAVPLDRRCRSCYRFFDLGSR